MASTSVLGAVGMMGTLTLVAVMAMVLVRVGSTTVLLRVLIMGFAHER